LPITEHSTSLPPPWASTITLGSWARALATASSSSSSGLVTLAIPTLEPRRAGFTQTGNPIAATCSRQPGAPASQKSTCGIP
jgi:hypothetical protein